MKKTLVLLLAFCLLLGLAACGGTSGGTDGGSGGTKATEAETTAAPAAQVYDVGEFTVEVPANYFICEQTDPFGEKDEEGNYPVRTDMIALVKDGEDAWDIFSKATVYITKFETSSVNPEFTKEFYEDAADVECSINGIECTAFTGNSTGTDDEVYTYAIIFYPISDEFTMQITLPLSVNGDSVAIDDPDAQAIMSSIKLK